MHRMQDKLRRPTLISRHPHIIHKVHQAVSHNRVDISHSQEDFQQAAQLLRLRSSIITITHQLVDLAAAVLAVEFHRAAVDLVF